MNDGENNQASGGRVSGQAGTVTEDWHHGVAHDAASMPLQIDGVYLRLSG